MPGAPAAADADAAAADTPAGAAAEPPPEPACRVCYDGADDTYGGELLAPCQCKGTMRYVHQYCLWEWLQVGRVQQGRLGAFGRKSCCSSQHCSRPHGNSHAISSI